MATKVAAAKKTKRAGKVSKAAKAKKVEKEAAPKAPKAVKAEVPAVENSEKSVSKTTTANIDRIVRLVIDHFKLNEKEVKTALHDLLPSTSEFRKKGKKKDPNAPKRALSAYMYFTKDQRDAVKADMPEGTPLTEVTRELGKRWGKMSDSDKAGYQKQADADKERYAKEMAKYREENGLNEPKKNEKADNPDYILNPESNKYVKRDGKIGKKLVEAEGGSGAADDEDSDSDDE